MDGLVLGVVVGAETDGKGTIFTDCGGLGYARINGNPLHLPMLTRH